MNFPLRITYRDIEPTPAIEAAVREHADKLSKYHSRISSCEVAIEAPHHRHRKGNHYRVRVEVIVPGREIVVGRDPKDASDHEDVYVAIRDAFDAAARALAHYVDRKRDLARQP
ncbi:MAG: ribosome-associated translation inhibitor RaiA [Deltaproteobacteria bacterium]|nr:MAG: ribosome-associated translation inhibitor RaiA [Deltaproteobacteria bacterium]